MNKVYLVAPLLAVAVFAGYYWHYHRRHIARIDEANRQAEAAKEARRREELAAREQAHSAALAAREQRHAELAAKAAEETAVRAARAEAEQRRAHAANEERKLRQRIDQLKADVGALQTAVARTLDRERELKQEQTFLNQYMELAEENRGSLQRLLERLDRPGTKPPRRSPPPTPAPVPARNG